MKTKKYYIGVRRQDKDVFESYLDRVGIQYTPVMSDVFNSNGFMYKMHMDPESEMYLKLSNQVTICLRLDDI